MNYFSHRSDKMPGRKQLEKGKVCLAHGSRKPVTGGHGGRSHGAGPGASIVQSQSQSQSLSTGTLLFLLLQASSQACAMMPSSLRVEF